MVEIPEYVAKEELDTDRRGMPQPVVVSGMGQGLEQLGQALTGLGARIAQNQKNAETTKSNYALEDLRNAAAVKQQEIIQNAPESGAGMHDSMTDWIDQKIGEISETLPEDQREAFKHKSLTVRTQFSIDTADKEYGQNKDYHTRNTQKTAADRSMSLAQDPTKWQGYWDEMQKWVDDLPNMTIADRAKLKESLYETLAIGKSIGDASVDPEEAKGKIGFPTTTSPEKTLPLRVGTQAGRLSVVMEGTNPEVVKRWEQAQGAMGFQADVVSAYRSEAKNRQAGGAPGSQHIHGNALDINLIGLSISQKQAVIRAASAAGFGGINVYPGGRSVHIDLGRKRHWNTQPDWAKKAIADHEAGRRVSTSGPFDDGVVGATPTRTRVGSLETPMVPSALKTEDVQIVTPNQMNTIANEEDLKLKAYWDTDKYRIGYGSDTYTTADGKHHPVTKDTVITKDDAVRDLKRRSPEFIGTIKRQIGEEAWGNLSQKARDILPSFAYQHGSLTGPVKAAALTGNDEAIAKAIENDKFTPARRAREAAYLRGGGEDIIYNPPSDRAQGNEVGTGGVVQVTDPAYSGMSIQWRLQRLNQIEAEQNRIAQERQKEAVVVLEQSKKNMLAALRENGEYTGEEPTLDLFLTADPRKGRIEWREFQVEKVAAATVNKIATMDVSQARKIRQQAHEAIPKGALADVYSRAYDDIAAAVKDREQDFDKMYAAMSDKLKDKLDAEERSMKEGMSDAEKLVKEKQAFKQKIAEQTVAEGNVRRKVSRESEASIEEGFKWRKDVIKGYIDNLDNVYQTLRQTGQFPEKGVPDKDDFMEVDPINGMENYLTFLEKSWAAIASNEMYTANDRRIAEILSEAAADTKTKAKQDALNIVTKAAQEVIDEREKDPFGAVINHYDTAKRLWDEVEDDPNNKILKQSAVNMTFEIQKSWGMPNETLAILPKKDSDTIVTHFKNPERDTQANQNELLSLLDEYEDAGAKTAIMGQLLRDGLPKLNSPAVDAYLSNRPPTSVTNLFEAARSTKIGRGEEGTSDQKLGELVRDQFTREGGGYYYGTSVFSSYNNERFENAVDLLTKSARMRMAADSSLDESTAISEAINDLIGDDVAYDKRLRSGPQIKAMLRPDQDENIYGRGLNRYTEIFIKEAMDKIQKQSPVISPGVPDPGDPTKFLIDPGAVDYSQTAQRNLEQQNLLSQLLRDGIYINYEKGFAFYNTTLKQYLADANGQPMIITNEMIEDLGKGTGYKYVPQIRGLIEESGD